jgi:hypothetical protein
VAHGAGASIAPFGEPPTIASDDIASKPRSPMRSISTPLRDLAVLHNGRVKILDTMAREMVGALTGRRDFEDFIMPEDARTARHRQGGYDPLFTLLDMRSTPRSTSASRWCTSSTSRSARRTSRWRSRATRTRSPARWKKLGRISPAMVEASAPICSTARGSAPVPRGDPEGRAGQPVRLRVNNLLLIAPESPDRHLAPHRRVASRGAVLRGGAMARATRGGRATPTGPTPRSRLAEVLPTINAELYPTTRRSLELAYNRSNAFEWGYWAYFFSVAGPRARLRHGARWLIVTGNALLIAALALHAFGLHARCLIAERFAIQNQFESMTGLSLFAALVGLGRSCSHASSGSSAPPPRRAGSSCSSPRPRPRIPGPDIEREAAILNTSVLLKYHVTTVLTSYGLITLGFVVSLFYLGRTTRRSCWAAEPPRSPSQAVGGAAPSGAAEAVRDTDARAHARRPRHGPDDRPAARVLDARRGHPARGLVGRPLLGPVVGVRPEGDLGADHLDRLPHRDPCPLRREATRPSSPRGSASSGSIVMLWTYFGVNLLLPGLHAYA